MSVIRPSSRGSSLVLRATENAAPAAGPPAMWRRLAGPGLGFAGGLALAALVVAGAGWAPSRPQAAPPAATSTADPAQLLGRLERLEAALPPLSECADRALAAATRAEAAARSSAQQALAGPAGERFLAAALLLQSSIATPRPWLREWQVLADLAPPEALPRPLAEVLGSHAARGLPTEAELRERFAALAPQLVARAPKRSGLVEDAANTLRGALATFGLAAPPPPPEAEQAAAAILGQLRRGNLAGAAADAAALDASLQPLLAGWLAQARARLAVEQAVQEVLLRALARPPRPA